MRNDAYLGTEFDWLAADSLGRLAVFSTAGYGAISATALANADKQDLVIRLLIPPRRRLGDSDFLTSDVAPPFYVYDWKLHDGPYVLKKRPAAGAVSTIDALPTESRAFVTRMLLDFSTCGSISDPSKEPNQTPEPTAPSGRGSS